MSFAVLVLLFLQMLKITSRVVKRKIICSCHISFSGILVALIITVDVISFWKRLHVLKLKCIFIEPIPEIEVTEEEKKEEEEEGEGEKKEGEGDDEREEGVEKEDTTVSLYW